jgi:hypothetical protein
MHRGSGIGALCALLTLGQARGARAEVTVTRIDYHGWQGAYRLANRTVELVFVPQIGRVMRYGIVGGPNVLWENPQLAGKTTDLAAPGKDWANYGGDKLWPAPQARWGWPPDPTLESAPQTVKVLPNRHLRITGPIGKAQQVRFQREIALDADGTGVTLKNTLCNTSAQRVEWSVWEVAQVDDPTEMRLPLNRAGKFSQGYHIFEQQRPAPESLSLEKTLLRLRRNPKQAGKVGSDSPLGWIEATASGLNFRVSATFAPGKSYPDDGCSLEIYTSDDPNKYVELELLSPLKTLHPNETITFTTHWRLSGN